MRGGRTSGMQISLIGSSVDQLVLKVLLQPFKRCLLLLDGQHVERHGPLNDVFCLSSKLTAAEAWPAVGGHQVAHFFVTGGEQRR